MLARGIPAAEVAGLLWATAEPAPPGGAERYGAGQLDAFRAVAAVRVFTATGVGEETGQPLQATSPPVYAGQAGAFLLRGLTPGPRQVVAWADADGDGRLSPGDGFGYSPPVTVVRGRTVADVIVELTPYQGPLREVRW